MPSGRVHNLINIAVYSVIAGAAVAGVATGMLMITPAQAASFTAAYAAGTFLLSPDLDLAEGHVDSKRHWGLLGFLWVPYGRMFSHRGLSHTWILGPLTRLVYVSIIVLSIFGVLAYIWPNWQWPRLPQPLNITFVLPLILGYYISQWLHLIADGVRPDHGLRRSQHKIKQFRKKQKRSSKKKS